MTKVLCDDCLELEAYIRSNTANNIYKLDRDVPKMVMPGETSDISQLCELEFLSESCFQMKLPLVQRKPSG